MPSITQQLDVAFRSAIREAFGLDADPLIAPSASPQHGDYQSNAAMGLVKRVGEATGAKANPRQIAEQIKGKLSLGGLASEVSIAGPGFINVRLDAGFLAGELNAVLAGDCLGIAAAASPQTVVIDYGGPNVAKEMHVGHLRSTIIGDCLARVSSFLGHDVIRQNHLGDWGTQFGMLIAYGEVTGNFRAERLIASRRRDDPEPFHASGGVAAMGSHIADLETWYREARKWFDLSEDNRSVARDRVVALQSGDEVVRAAWSMIVEESRHHFVETFIRLGVQLAEPGIQREPIERGESFYNSMLADVVDTLVKAGVAVDSAGALVAFVPPFEAPLIVRKSDGGYGYGTTDVAAVRYRVATLRATRLIYVVGTPQHQHLAQVFDVACRAGFAPADVTLEHAAFGSVLGQDGKLFRTRTGGTVKLRDVLDEAEARALALVAAKDATAEPHRKLPPDAMPAIARAVGIGAVKYFDLLRDRVGDYRFSYDAMLAMDGNTAPYLQYAHARVRSIFRRAGREDASPDATIALRVHAIDAPTERALAKLLLRFGETVDAVARELKPHFLCTYLYELAGAFSAFYDACPVLKSDEPTRTSRLALCSLTARTLATGLDLLGIEHPEQM